MPLGPSMKIVRSIFCSADVDEDVVEAQCRRRDGLAYLEEQERADGAHLESEGRADLPVRRR